MGVQERRQPIRVLLDELARQWRQWRGGYEQLGQPEAYVPARSAPRTADRHDLTQQQIRLGDLPDTLLRAAVAASPLPILTLDRHGVVTSWNAAAERLLGWTAEEVLGRPLPTVPRDKWDEFHELNQHILQGESLIDVGVRRQRKDGSLIDLSISTAPLYDTTGAICGAMAIYSDVTERRQSEAELLHQALHDPLTQLPNRMLLHDRLDHSLQVAHRQRSTFALLLIDLNRFKEVNDTLGHHVGDLLLHEVARCLAGVVRESDTLARLGGDEFALLLPDADEEGAIQVAQKLAVELEQPIVVEGQSFHIGVSVGIVVYPEHGEDTGSLLRRADIAMYRSKRTGRGYTIYEPRQELQS